MSTTSIFSDFNVNLDIHPIKGDLSLLYDADSVKRSIKNLLFTEPYERPFNPQIGAGLKAYLFENVNSDTQYLIREKIRDVINNYEPRANLIEVLVKVLPDENAYYATIIFSVNNNINPITLDVILRRVR
jgi:phage baseplate assembly protein W